MHISKGEALMSIGPLSDTQHRLKLQLRCVYPESPTAISLRRNLMVNRLGSGGLRRLNRILEDSRDAREDERKRLLHSMKYLDLEGRSGC